MENLIDVSYLQAPVNVFKWNAAQIGEMMKAVPRESPSYAVMAQSHQWMLHLAEKMPNVKHHNPIILLAVGNLALERTQRQSMILALQGIDQVEAAAYADHQQQVPTPDKTKRWAEVE